MPLDPTAPPERSFVASAQGSPFPIQNLPFGAFSTDDRPAPRLGVAIGDEILDLAALEAAGRLDLPALGDARPLGGPTLNPLLALGPPAWSALRRRIARLLAADEPELQADAALRARALVPRAGARMHLPVAIGDYTDFYASREHATNVGTMFRGPDNALLPNWLHLPVGYHGRASSVVVSGTPVRRPLGQTKAPDAAAPSFGPTRQLDFELELGVFVGPGNAQGEPIPIAGADDHLFGMVLLNDWSARDVQAWEYVPLGPFLAKNFATTISPWVVPMAALAPFRVPGPAQDPEPLPYLRAAGPGAYDIRLEARLRTARMRAEGIDPVAIARTNARHLYWDFRQQLAHHTITGCPLRPGDLLGSGTISGPEREARGSLLELAWRGAEPLRLPTGEARAFLEDGDELVLAGWCAGDGYRIGFGEAAGVVLPAHEARPPGS